MPANGAGLHRKAAAGLEILQGSSTRQALLKQGYADSTTRNPSQNGLGEKHCVEAAKIVYPKVNIGQLVESARRVTAAKLDRLEKSESALDDEKLSSFPKLLQVLETFYGGQARSAADDARQFLDRLEFLQAIGTELTRRRAKPQQVVLSPSPQSDSLAGVSESKDIEQGEVVDSG